MTLVMLLILAAYARGSEPCRLRIGSKKFTESIILADMAVRLARLTCGDAAHERGLGGTRILWSALLRGEIDLYPEYTGTIRRELLAGGAAPGTAGLQKALADKGVTMSEPLGFNNTYAIGMKARMAAALGITTISDLRKHPDLRFGFSNEFMDRSDGWPGLRRYYRLPQTNVTDVYTTDADIRYYHLRVLVDDRSYFPDYSAVFLYRAGLPASARPALKNIFMLEHRISDREMSGMNAQVKIDGEPDRCVAAEFLARHFSISSKCRNATLSDRLLRTTRQHLFLVLISLSAALAIALPLGILSFKYKAFGQAILAVVGIIQTVPSLALLVFMIPLLGIGNTPAIVALFLYSLLPIVRNTNSGLGDIAPSIRESAEALGLGVFARMRLIELPLAARSILAGVKTSAVINVGTATLGALIGAGGYGQPILTGIRLDDVGLILEGAVPAAVMALAVQALFDLLERLAVSKGLRIAPSSE
jgi:osmoprotectant transport system permease protein